VNRKANELERFRGFFNDEKAAIREGGNREDALAPGLLTVDSSVLARRLYVMKENLRAGINISKMAKIKHLLVDFDCKDEDEMRQYIPSLLKFEQKEVRSILKTAT
jgi:hypothetical protein